MKRASVHCVPRPCTPPSDARGAGAPLAGQRRHLGRAFAALAVGLGLPAATTHAAADDDGADVVVENAGDQANAISLPAPAQIGQSAQVTLTMDMDLGMEGSGMSENVGVGLAMTMTSEVIELTPDGGYVTLTTLDGVEVTDVPDGVSESDMPCVGVTGLQLHQTFDASGNELSTEVADESQLGPEGDACIEQLDSTQSQAAVVYPDEPIGPGAQWSADIVTENQGISVPVTYVFTLADVTDDRYTIDVSLDSEFDYDDSGLSGSGTITGSGTTIGSVDNVLDVAGSFDMGMSMDASGGGQDLSMTVDIAIDIESGPSVS
jgi:hypothetical protein